MYFSLDTLSQIFPAAPLEGTPVKLSVLVPEGHFVAVQGKREDFGTHSAVREGMAGSLIWRV